MPSRIERYLDDIEDPELHKAAWALHEKLNDFGGEITARMAYGIPFYYGRRRIFYIILHDDVIHLGFCQGARLIDGGEMLAGTDRKQIRFVRIRQLNDLNDPRINDLIYQAIELDRFSKE